MYKKIAVIAVLFMFLAACAGPAATAIQPAAATTSAAAVTQPAAAATDLPVATAASAATAAVTTTTGGQAPAASSGAVVYQIVPGQSKVSYQVDETLLNENNRLNTAVGVTQGISGTIQIDHSQPANSKLGPFTVDVSQLTSDSGRRDQYIRTHFLESSRFPTVTFNTTKVSGLPASIQDGVDNTFQVTGDLTIHQVTKPATFNVTARLTGTTLTGQANTQILMSDFGIGPITLFNLLNTKDQVNVTFQFTAQPQGQ